MRAGELILAHFVTAYQHLLADGVAAARSWGKAITRRVQGWGCVVIVVVVEGMQQRQPTVER